MKSYAYDDMALAGGDIYNFVKKHFKKNRIIINSFITDTDLFEIDSSLKGLKDNLVDLLEKFDALHGEVIVEEMGEDVMFNFEPFHEFKLMGKRVKIEYEKDHRIDDFKEGGGERELYIKNKADYIAKNSPVDGHENLEERRKCLNCQSVFEIKDFKVIAGPEIDYIVCPHYPICRGDILDWEVTTEEVKTGNLIDLYNSDRDSYEQQLKIQDNYLDRYYGYREIDRFVVNPNEGLVVYFVPKKDSILQMVILKASMVTKYGKELEKIIRSEQAFGFMPDSGFCPSIMFLNINNLKHFHIEES